MRLLPAWLLTLALGLCVEPVAQAASPSSLQEEFYLDCDGEPCPVHELKEPKRRAARLADLQQDFNRGRNVPAKIYDCSLVIEEPFGRGFSALGALCSVSIEGKRNAWMICNDDGVGNFAAIPLAPGRQDRKKALAEFAKANCRGG